MKLMWWGPLRNRGAPAWVQHARALPGRQADAHVFLMSMPDGVPSVGGSLLQDTEGTLWHTGSWMRVDQCS